MTKDEQKEIVVTMTTNMQKSMLEKIDAGAVPENWDGIELRRWLGYVAKDFEAGTFGGARKRAYKNDLLLRNL